MPEPTKLTDLPEDIAPTAFFQLVAAELAAQPVPPGAPDDKAVVTLTGDGGGSWTIAVHGGEVTVAEGDAQGPLVHATMTVEDWRSFVAGRVRDVVRGAAGRLVFDPAELAKLQERAGAVEALRALPGTLVVRLDDAETGGSYALAVTTGGAPVDVETPTATITIKVADMASLIAGQEDPMTAFFSGKIALDGDMNHVMGLFGALNAS